MSRPPEAMRARKAAPPAIPDPGALAKALKERACTEGFGMAGICALAPSEHFPHMTAWLARGYHGEMSYLARSDALDRRADPGLADTERGGPRLRSALVVADFYPAGEDRPASPDRGIVARYARGRDYHRVVKGKLRRVLRWLEDEAGTTFPWARASVDTSPVLERELARRAGLGWFGRNTMMIHPRRGSYFFLGTLLLDMDLPADDPYEADHCGTCNACVDACPTGALLGRDANGAPVMDARRCISYLTIEHRGAIPVELRPLLGNRVFGCDICQEACPFTRRFAEVATEPGYANRSTDAPSLTQLLQMALSPAAWEEFSRGSSVRRAGRGGFARNVCVALGNWGDPKAVPALVGALRDAEPVVRGHAAWALGRIRSVEALGALRDQLACDPDPTVASEITRALADRGADAEMIAPSSHATRRTE